MHRKQIIHEINSIIGEELLVKAVVKDEMANGVQIHGADEVSKIAFGVSCNLEFLEAAVEWGAQMCIFHHGLDVRTHKSRFPKYFQDRLRIIFQNDVSILGFHYALDAHKEIGNNAQIIQALDGEIVDTLFQEWGFVAKLKEAKSLKELKEECSTLFSHEVLHFGSEDRQVQTIGVVSGAAKPHALETEEMLSKGVELYISGETSEATPHKMIESGIDYFVCGHYVTETFGVKALEQALSERLTEIETQFIDVSNPV